MHFHQGAPCPTVWKADIPTQYIGCTDFLQAVGAVCSTNNWRCEAASSQKPGLCRNLRCELRDPQKGMVSSAFDQSCDRIAELILLLQTELYPIWIYITWLKTERPISLAHWADKLAQITGSSMQLHHYSNSYRKIPNMWDTLIRKHSRLIATEGLCISEYGSSKYLG